MAVTETRTLPAQFIEDLGKDYAKQLTATTAIPIDTSKFAPEVAAQDALQTQAATLAGSGVGSFQPFIQAAQQQVTDAGATLSGIAGLTGAPTAAQTQAFTSPFQQQVIDESLRQFDRSRATGLTQIGDQAFDVGAFGGGRQGALEGQFMADTALGRAGLEAQLRAQGFADAAARRAQAFGQQQALAAARAGLAGQQLGLGQFQTGLGQALQGFQGTDIARAGQVGAANQAQAQAVLGAQQEAARLAAYEPLERLGIYGSGVTGLMGGYPAQYQFTSQPDPSPLATALGVGTTLSGIYGNIRGAFTSPFTG